jgi:hypothetical protein
MPFRINFSLERSGCKVAELLKEIASQLEEYNNTNYWIDLDITIYHENSKPTELRSKP